MPNDFLKTIVAGSGDDDVDDAMIVTRFQLISSTVVACT